jgi:hypothetical protein
MLNILDGLQISEKCWFMSSLEELKAIETGLFTSATAIMLCI